MFATRCLWCHTGRRFRHQLKKRYLWTSTEFDVIVVGGGHAGTEAACAAARMGANTLLLTHNLNTIGEMSCNPSFGGIGKGHLMKEVDALDGVCAKICDKSGIHYKVLNKRKGPAVWGPRAQIDRGLYKQLIQKEVMHTRNLTVQACPVEDLVLTECVNPSSDLARQTCCGVSLGDSQNVHGKTVILTTGTFLRGQINIGLEKKPAGRIGEQPSIGLAKSLDNAGFILGRLKTGTPPRLDGSTIDYSKTTAQIPDDPPQPFSFMNDKVWIKPSDQLKCYCTYTNENVSKFVKEHLHLSHHVTEEVTGPRYCPSIESKVLRFSNQKHPVWLEPEGLSSSIVYPQGLSCTLPTEYQQQMLRLIPGLENVVITQTGYGVEYDYINPQQIRPSLETKSIENLFFAGQINGTTGYEEAAAQGIIAGINSVRKVNQLPPFIINRTDGYIGVLVNDLTTHGTNEPYRMFTSRSEFRLALRPDNADLRLTFKGYEAGCVSQERYDRARNVQQFLTTEIENLKTFFLAHYKWGEKLKFDANAPTNTQRRSAFQVLSDNRVSVQLLADAFPERLGHLMDNPYLSSRLKVEASYDRLLEGQREEIDEVRREEQLQLPDNINYGSLNVSNEVKLKLDQARPQTIAAASRIQGMTPAAILILLRFVKNRKVITTV